MVTRYLFLAAAAVGAVSAVTLETSTPTESSNYMVMQGDFEYVVGGVNLGAVSGRAQLVRSALQAESTFSFSIKIENYIEGAVLEAVVRRHRCSLPNAKPYQDPYVCPGYNSIQGINSCDSQSVGDANPIEVRMLCSVDANGKCEASFLWSIYIPDEEYEGQALEDLAIELFPQGGGSTFVCADFSDNRDTTATFVTAAADGSGNKGELALGGMQKDELGYTHVYFLAQSLAASFTYGAYVADGPCESQFSAPQAIAGLEFTFVTDGNGAASDVTHFVPEIAGPAAQALVVTDCIGAGGVHDSTNGCASGRPMILCYDLELMVAAGARQGRGAGADPNVGVKSYGGNSQMNGALNKQSVYRSNQMDVDAEDEPISSCEAWQHLYNDAGASSGKGGKGKGKGKGKAGAFGQFKDKQIGGVTRCCVSHQYEIGKTKEGKRFAKAGALHGVQKTDHGSSIFVGVGAGIAGAVVLAFGVMLHMRRTQRSALPDYACNPSEVSENTPLTNKVELIETDIDAVATAHMGDEGSEPGVMGSPQPTRAASEVSK